MPGEYAGRIGTSNPIVADAEDLVIIIEEVNPFGRKGSWVKESWIPSRGGPPD
jgi:hypothetical protein